ncbi:MAG: DoxX family membrane protein [Acidobacteria bacterium]|nr:DoxX family membrane protein [Acidobacteriota bacterium]
MKYIPLVSRLLLGLIFFIFGLNNILHFLHMPYPSGDALTWFGIMAAHGWMTFVGVIMVVAGLLLLVGRFVPLALVLLAPVIVNILLYHALLWPHGYIPAIVVAVLEVVLLLAYHRSFAPLLVPDPAADTRKL